MRRKRLLHGLMTGILMLMLVSGGCGKKGDPISPRIKVPAAITDLSVVPVREGIALDWSLTDPAEEVREFKILRSETVQGNRACPGCPQDYRPLRTLAAADDRLHREKEKRFRYVDPDARAGSDYSYRIVVCNHAGHCGEASNEAGLIHSGR
jgi:hypothetical protein